VGFLNIACLFTHVCLIDSVIITKLEKMYTIILTKKLKINVYICFIICYYITLINEEEIQMSQHSNITLEFNLTSEIINYFKNNPYITSYNISFSSPNTHYNDIINFTTSYPYLIILHIHKHFLNNLLSE
jgi:hypothetical protein